LGVDTFDERVASDRDWRCCPPRTERYASSKFVREGSGIRPPLMLGDWDARRVLAETAARSISVAIEVVVAVVPEDERR
jgi:hypothetical protein